VFFNLFFEAEPFAAILIAQGTNGRNLEFVLEGQNLRSKAGSGEGVLGEGQPQQAPSPPVRGSGRVL